MRPLGRAVGTGRQALKLESTEMDVVYIGDRPCRLDNRVMTTDEMFSAVATFGVPYNALTLSKALQVTE